MTPPDHSRRDNNRTPDRDARRPLSSVVRFLPAGIVLVSVATCAATLTTMQASQLTTATPVAPGGTAIGGGPGVVANDPLWPAVQEWNRLQQSDRLPFTDYSRFLIAHRGWPGEPALRRAAERAIRPDGQNAADVVAFFDLYPPTTGPGRARYAEALASLGLAPKARDAAAVAWTAGPLGTEDEARLIARFAGQFTPLENDQRMDMLLWDRATASATRQLALVSPQRRPMFAARLAFQTRAADAATQGQALGPGAERDAGFVIDHARWMQDTAQWSAARTSLSQPMRFDAPPTDAEAYLKALFDLAKAAAADRQWATAYGIAANIDQAYVAGTLIRNRPLAERDPYTSLAWLGGTAALKQLNRPRDAEAMFRRYTLAAQSPGSQTKGQYWAGRAAQAAGDTAGANVHYASAAASVDQYYGQLAAERLGQRLAVPADPAQVAIPPEVRAEFDKREIVRAARLLGPRGDWQDQTQFVRKIAADATTDTDHVLVAELARSIGRPDLGVILSRNARQSGARDPLRTGFPTVAVPPAMASHWTIIHAISRQESQFDREARSPVGARGLMQLMPATAREQAGKIGLPYQPERLTQDIGYNVSIGSAFFDRMLTYYNGNYVLAVASYNAGPGNVNKFIRANGDPRLPGVDVVDWVEAIPFTETRAYVQKVLENAVVYDLYNPGRARAPAGNRLSYYLGKTSAG
ncbi:lytic transglycosylase domain-containing protein [uncultured Sphingomonas sp.]|uniref:lytic transglycosylase domain-containing protein n=1 Tax=uncultured Sphingomonas sp. TaxID=158754 RepID=UPI0025F76223|nr:lytic transglycosylase domain-containing protein [uncultured Sphingomonas sp.]